MAFHDMFYTTHLHVRVAFLGHPLLFFLILNWMLNFPTGTGNGFTPFLDKGEKETDLESKYVLCTGLLKYATSNAGSNGTQ